jgi:cysteinyl-tRNA synthetase
MAALGAEPPDIEPRATDHIEEMKALIAELIEKGFAYEAMAMCCSTYRLGTITANSRGAIETR